MFPSVTLNRAVWTTKDGRVLKPREFTDTHLINTIKYLENKAESLKNKEELALLAHMAEKGKVSYELVILAQLEPMEWLRGLKIYRLLRREARKRKLKI